MDFKVRCISTNSQGEFTIGKIYEVINGTVIGDNKTIFNTWGDSRYGSGRRNTFESFSRWFSDKFELVPERPHICEVLGVELNQPFNILGCDGKNYRIHSEDEVSCDGCNINIYYDFIYAINHPEKITLIPQFSEDEKALMRLYVGAGLPWIARDKDGGIEAYEVEPDKEPTRFMQNDWDDEHTKFLSKFLPQITFENSPFNAAEYLEGLK